MTQDAAAGALTVGLAQIAPVWLDRARTLDKMIGQVHAAADQGCHLVAFGEALLPGYPFWIERTDGARFNSPVQKEIHAHYLDQAVQIEAGQLDPLCTVAAAREYRRCCRHHRATCGPGRPQRLCQSCLYWPGRRRSIRPSQAHADL